MILLDRLQATLPLVLLAFAIAGPSQSTAPIITFYVQDYTTAQPLQGATILLLGAQSITQETGANGIASIAIQFGNYQITVGKSQCSPIGPQQFVVDETAPPQITVKLQCSPSGSPPLETPSLRTDNTTYHRGDVLNWQTAGFAPGAYIRPCLGSVCGGIAQSDSIGEANGAFVITAQLSGTQTFSVTNMNTGASAQGQITISS
jgi:hypothetical protein